MTTPRHPSPAVPATRHAVAVAAFACLSFACSVALGATPGPTGASAPPAVRTSASASGAGWVLEPGGPTWAELTPQQRDVLAPLSAEWNRVDATGKEKWLEVSHRFPHMTPDEQARVRARMVEWVRMTPQQRSRARLVFQENREVSKEQRQALWQQYQALPADKKKELAQKELARRSPPASAAPASGASAVHPRPATDLESVQPKSNLVRTPNPATASPRPVAPVIVQARPGATTTLVNKTPIPPAHQKEGQGKIAVGENEVDRTTLLPRKGPQRAGGPASSNGSAVPHPVPHPVVRPVPRPAAPAPASAALPPSPTAPAASRP